MAAAGLQKLHDPKLALHSWVENQGGEKAYSANAQAHRATVGAHSTNDRVESNFGCFDYYYRRFRGVSVEAASAVSQQMRMHYFDPPSMAVSDRRKAKSAKPARGEGFFYQLPYPFQLSIVEASRRARLQSRVEARADRRMHDAYKAACREAKLTKQFEKAVDLYTQGKELFNKWQARRVRSVAEARTAMHGLSDAAALRFLKEQILMRVIGCGWAQFETPWSSNVDSHIGTQNHLQEVLRTILVFEDAEESSNRLPTAAAPPILRGHTLKVLGTPTCDIEDVEKEAEINAEQLEAAAAQELQRRMTAGVTDDVQDVMPFLAPPLTSQALLNRRLEILWGLYVLPDGTRTKMWCPCTVLRVADGSNDKGSHGKGESSRARKLLPAGAVLVQWEPDIDRGEEEATVMWLILSPDKWTTKWEGHLAWRWHPAELAAFDQ